MGTRVRFGLGLVIATAILSVARPTAQVAAAEIDVDAAFRAVAHYHYGESRKALQAMEQLVLRASGPDANSARAFRRGLADRMASLLTSKEATPAAKAFVCGQLAVIGGEEQAPVLASLLTDRELADPALRALSQIPGPAVDRILRDCLGTLSGNLRIGAVNALGERRDREAVGPLSAILAGADEASACAAANALGKIGGEPAAAALEKALATAKGRLRNKVAHACLACADRLLVEKKAGPAARIYARLSAPGETQPVRMAALRGSVFSDPEKAAASVSSALTSGDPALENMALRLVPAVPGPAASKEFARCLGKTPPAVQALLIGALAARSDGAARGAIEAAASSQDPAVRLAALKALGKCGDETAARVLTERLMAGAAAEADAARESLMQLRGSGVNAVLAGMISQAGARAKAELIRILAARNASGVTGALSSATADPDPAVRKEAWKALGSLAKGPEAGLLVESCVRVRPEDRDDAERAVAAALKRAGQPEMRAVLRGLDAVPPPERAAILRIVSAVGDDLALPALRQAVRCDDSVVRDAAVRGLAAWPTPAAFEDLVTLAREAKEPVHRVLALRAAIRLSSKVEGRSPAQMTRFVSQLIELAQGAAERKAVLAELGRCATVEALHLAEKHLADPALATEAGLAVTQIASALRDSHRSEVLAALRPFLTRQADPVLSGRAAKVLKDILKPTNLALGATATNPDGLAADGAAGGPQAAIDGNPNTYWDEVDGAAQYRLRVTFPRPTEVSSINLLWHPYEQHQAKNFDVLCDGKLVKEVRGATPFENEMFVPFAPVRCTSVELVIPGRNGLVSPCIHEFQIFSHFPPESIPGRSGGASQAPEYRWKQADGVLALTNHGRVVWQWMDFSLVDSATGQPGGIAILDHPSNPRHPSQWHNVMAASARFGYFSPAMLWSEPYRLAAGQRFTLRYRILIHPGRGEKDTIDSEWRNFASQ